MSEKPIYCGKGKVVKVGEWEKTRIRVCITDIPAEHRSQFNGKEYVSLDVKAMRQPDDKGNTLTVTVDTWKPTRQDSCPAEHTALVRGYQFEHSSSVRSDTSARTDEQPPAQTHRASEQTDDLPF